MANGLGLEDVYGATLGRIQAQGGERSRLGVMALMWICHSERPLKADELCHALGVEIGSADFDPDNVPSIRTVLSCCQGLVVVDKEGSTVRLVHFTLREYLSGRPDLFQKPHSVIAETCLTYLNSQQVMSLSATLPLNTQAIPFLRYSALHWGEHGKKELSDDVKSLALKLVRQYDNHISIGLLLESQHIPLHQSSDLSPFTGLHCASFFGLIGVVRSLIEMGGFGINQGGPMGITPLGWAAHNGHAEVAELLLGQRDANPDKSDEDGRTTLAYAAMNGHEEVAQLLLRRGDVNPDKPDDFGRTPLAYAAMDGHEGVAYLLLGRGDVNPDKPGDYGRTPLAYAAMNGHEGVVRLLLGRGDINPDRPDIVDRTPLSHAATNGHEGVVRLLLGRGGVSPERPDKLGRTPLLYAAMNGHEGVAQLLLGQENVNPNNVDWLGRTPLSRAAWNGHEGVVQLLLGRADINPDKPDNVNRTPLACAAQNGHDRVVQLLLGRGDINPDMRDNLGLTPLEYADNNKHKGVVKSILDWKSSHLPLPRPSES